MSADTFRVSGSNAFKAQFQADLNSASENPEIAEMIKALEASEEDVAISEASSVLGAIQNFFSEGSGDDNHVLASNTSVYGTGVSVEYSQINGVDIGEVKSESSEVLAHELQHAADFLGIETAASGKPTFDRMPAEARAVETANKLRIMRKKSIRRTYKGKPVVDENNKILKALLKK